MSRRPADKRTRTATDFYAPEDPDLQSCKNEVNELKQQLRRLKIIINDYETSTLKDSFPVAPYGTSSKKSKAQQRVFNQKISQQMSNFRKNLQASIDKMEKDGMETD